jgi:hypothetical protein
MLLLCPLSGALLPPLRQNPHLPQVHRQRDEVNLEAGAGEPNVSHPPGIIDPRSWAYWNLKLGRDPTPPMPARRFA